MWVLQMVAFYRVKNIVTSPRFTHQRLYVKNVRIYWKSRHVFIYKFSIRFLRLSYVGVTRFKWWDKCLLIAITRVTWVIERVNKLGDAKHTCASCGSCTHRVLIWYRISRIHNHDCAILPVINYCRIIYSIKILQMSTDHWKPNVSSNGHKNIWQQSKNVIKHVITAGYKGTRAQLLSRKL